jgi:hypothetical protein
MLQLARGIVQELFTGCSGVNLSFLVRKLVAECTSYGAGKKKKMSIFWHTTESMFMNAVHSTKSGWMLTVLWWCI